MRFFSITILLITAFAYTSYAGYGNEYEDGGWSSSNPTGGFGKGYKEPANETGGFGMPEGGFQTKSMPTLPGPPPDIPLDGGASLLLAAGVGLGAATMARKKKKKKKQTTL